MPFTPEEFERAFPETRKRKQKPEPQVQPRAVGNGKNLTKGILPVLFIVAIALSGICFGGAWFLYRMYQTLPTLDQLENIEPPLSSKVMGRDGVLLRTLSMP